MALVERGAYITLLRRQLLSNPAARRNIAPIDMHMPMPSWNVAVIYRTQHQLSDVCRAFLEELKSVSRQIPASGDARR